MRSSPCCSRLLRRLGQQPLGRLESELCAMMLLATVLLYTFVAAWSIDDSWLVGKAHCADFNTGIRNAGFTQLNRPFVCPHDGIAGTYCSDTFSTRKFHDIKQSNLLWSDVVFYVLIGPKSNVDALLWWLQLVKEPIDMVFVADACQQGSGTVEGQCTDAASAIVARIAKDHPVVKTHLVRSLPADSGYSILSCKLRTGQKLIYNLFPERKYYFKFDTDTILFPRRLMNFLNTIDALAEFAHNSPLYFGTMVESGIPQLLCKHHSDGTKWRYKDGESICYCQGGAGYGLSNLLMKHMSTVKSCADSAPSDLPEDLFTALEVYNNFNHTVPIHCGGFRSSELVGDEWFRHSISFHYIDSRWLSTHGQKLISHEAVHAAGST